MALFDKLSQRGIKRLGKTPRQTKPIPTTPPVTGIPGDLPAMGQPTQRPLTTAPTMDKLSQRPQRGQLGSTFQGGKIQKRFIADLPANVQLQGIQTILSGQETNNPQLNEFVRGQAAQGKSPEEIRLAFIEQQKASPNPLVIL